MVEFNLWKEAFIFMATFATIIIVPCVLVTMMGRKMIDRLGTQPTHTPIIQMSIFWKFLTVEAITFVCLIAFFKFFSAK